MPPEHPTGTTDRPDTDAPGLEAMYEMQVKETAGWLDRIESVIERYPWPTLLIALGVGYAISRRMR